MRPMPLKMLCPMLPVLQSHAWVMSGYWDGTSLSAVMREAATTMRGRSGTSGSTWFLPTLPIMLLSTAISVGWGRLTTFQF